MAFHDWLTSVGNY